MFKGFGVTQWEAPYQGEELLAWAKKIGLKTVSIEFDSKACTDDPSTEEWAIGWRKNLEKYSLEPSILAINVLCDIGMSRPERETDCMYNISLALKAARAMGAPAVHMPSFFDGWIYNREQLDQTIKCLKYACELGERYGVKIGHEAVLPDEYYDIVLEELKEYEGTLYMLFDNENMSSRAEVHPRALKARAGRRPVSHRAGRPVRRRSKRPEGHGRAGLPGMDHLREQLQEREDPAGGGGDPEGGHGLCRERSETGMKKS